MATGELYLNTKSTQRRSSTSGRMAVPVEQLMELESDEILEWDVETLDATLKESKKMLVQLGRGQKRHMSL